MLTGHARNVSSVLLEVSMLNAPFSVLCGRCVCLNDADRWNTQQLLDHPFLNPPLPKTPLQCQDASPEGDNLSLQSSEQSH